MKVYVDQAVCVGHGRCYELAPDVFEEDERGHCVIRCEQLPSAPGEQARRAEANCPEGAISIEEE